MLSMQHIDSNQPRRFREGQFAQVEAEHVLIEEGQRSVGFFEPVERVFLGLCDVLEETADAAHSEVARMAFAIWSCCARPAGALSSRRAAAEGAVMTLAQRGCSSEALACGWSESKNASPADPRHAQGTAENAGKR